MQALTPVAQAMTRLSHRAGARVQLGLKVAIAGHCGRAKRFRGGTGFEVQPS
jgi:hypothetical protein